MKKKSSLFHFAAILFLGLYQQVAMSQVLMRLAPDQAPGASMASQAFAVLPGGKLTLENLKIDDSQSSVVNLELRRIEVTDAQTELVVHSGASKRIEKAAPRAHFSGKLQGENSSFVFLSVDSEGGMRSIIHRGDQVIVNELPAAGARGSLASSSRKVDRSLDFAGREFSCQVDPQFIEKTKSTASETLRKIVSRASASIEAYQSSELISSRRADIIVETDYEYFIKLGGSSTAAYNYAVDLFAYVSSRYQSEIGARLLIKQLNIYTTPADPWLQATSDGLLTELQSYWNSGVQASVSRHHVHMLSSKSGGGIAYLNTLGLPTYAYGVSMGITGGLSPSNPQIVWDSVVVAHELGHSFSSSHTHNFDKPYAGSSAGGAVDCCYSGDSTSQCAAQLGGAGRPGFQPGLGSIFGGVSGRGAGTIMSYCHMPLGGISNLSFTFGTAHPYGVNPDRIATVMQAAAQQYLPLDSVTSYPLAVTKSGTGIGTVASNPAGISCGADCLESYPGGTSVTLTATPTSGSTFAGWGGACLGSTSICTVGMTASKSVTANFASAPGTRLITVTKVGTGTGTFSSSPIGISCGTTCGVASASFPSTFNLTISATPATGSNFAGWSGVCTGVGSCTVAAGTNSISVGATFNTSNVENVLITGTPRNDTLVNGKGNNTVDGQAGVDTYVSFGQASQYSLSRINSTWRLSDDVGMDGVDTLSNVERLRFSTGLHLLDIDKGQISGMAYRIYKAAFNRQPDNGGLKYWVDRMDSDVNLIDVAAGFITSAEFIALYGSNSSNSDFIARIYSNVLNRAPDAGGFAYWIGILSAGTTRQQVLAGFSESNENIANVAATIANGIWLPN